MAAVAALLITGCGMTDLEKSAIRSFARSATEPIVRGLAAASSAQSDTAKMIRSTKQRQERTHVTACALREKRSCKTT